MRTQKMFYVLAVVFLLFGITYSQYSNSSSGDFIADNIKYLGPSIIIIVGLVFLCIGIFPLYRYRKITQSWSLINGKVVETDISRLSSAAHSYRHYYVPIVRYQYEYQGKTYFGEDSSRSWGNYGEAQGDLEKRVPSTAVHVFVDPKNSESSTLKKPDGYVDWFAFGFLGGGLFMIVIGIVIFVFI